MKIIICGLRGTGKTTLSHDICDKYNLTYVLDIDVLTDANVVYDGAISTKYADILLDYVSTHDDIVLDAEYSIAPIDYIKYDSVGVRIIYLGFASVDEDTLYRVFRESELNAHYTDDALREYVHMCKTLSVSYKAECDKHGLEYVDICKDRAKILYNL